MNRRELVTFAADFADDAQWDQKGNLLIPGGRAIAETIREKLQERGVYSSDVYQHSYYGWAFDAISENFKLWILIAAAKEGWLLQLVQQESLIARLFGSSNTAGFDGLQTKVHDILTGDTRFSNVLWYTKADYESGKKERARPSPR